MGTRTRIKTSRGTRIKMEMRTIAWTKIGMVKVFM